MTSYTCLPDTDGQAGGIRLAVFVDSTASAGSTAGPDSIGTK